MKNKKLFAILTLVCFMFTLMPVAAFAADGAVKVSVEGATAKAAVTAKNTENVIVSVDGNANAFYFFAVDADGNAVEMPILDTTASAIAFKVGDVFEKAGKYTVYAVESNGDDKVATVIGDAMTEDDVKAKLLLGSSYKDERVKKAATITVKYVKDSYDLAVYPVIDADGNLGSTAVNSISLDANGAFGAKNYGVVLKTEAGTEVEKATVKISHNGVNIAKQVVTNADGVAYFQVYGTVVGNFKIELSYADTEVEIPVTVGNVAPTEVSVVAEAKAPVDVNETSTEFGFGFKLVDANGNVITRNDIINTDEDGDGEFTNPKAALYKLSVVGPADSTVKATDLYLTYDSVNNYFEIGGIAADSELAEGKYTFTVSLANGTTASANVTVKEFDTPVALKMNYNATAGIGDTVALKALKYVDANGVTLNAKDDINNEVKMSVSGKGIASFDETNGTLVIENNDKLIGSKVTVVAVYDETIVATSEITIVEDAVALQYVNGTVEAGKNNTIVFNVVNENGEKIELNKVGATATSVIVAEKPEGAYVAATPINGTTVADNAKVQLTVSSAGTYEIMVVVTYTEPVTVAGVTNNVTRSVTGTAVIEVGAKDAQFKDVVVMSIGAPQIVVNSSVKAIAAAPMIQDNRTFVPFRALAEAFGAEVAWDEATQSVVAELNDVKVVMVIGANDYTVNGVAKTADVAPFINGASTMVPVRFVAEAFGINVTPLYAADGSVADVLFAK